LLSCLGCFFPMRHHHHACGDVLTMTHDLVAIDDKCAYLHISKLQKAGSEPLNCVA